MTLWCFMLGSVMVSGFVLIFLVYLVLFNVVCFMRVVWVFLE